MTDNTQPNFARLEIGISTTMDLTVAAHELRNLADELDSIAGSTQSEDHILIIAHHRIRSTSRKLRGIQ